MANFSITLANTLDVFGPALTSKWNASTWGGTQWGTTTDLDIQVIKVIDSTASPTSDDVRYILHVVNDEGTALTSDISRLIFAYVDSSISLGADMALETLQESNGYFYLFPDRVSNAENRASTAYTSGTVSAATWTQIAAVSTAWG